MRHIIDLVVEPGGYVAGVHTFDTSIEDVHESIRDTHLPRPESTLQMLADLYYGRKPIAGTGWDQLTNLPQYKGKTRLEAAIAEIVRYDDQPARKIIGV